VMAAGRAEIITTRELESGATLELSALTSLDTQYNALLGAVTHQASGSVGANWSRERWGVDTRVTASTTLPTDDIPAVRGITGSVVGTYHPAEIVELEAGVRAADQLLPPATAPETPIQWVAFVAVSVGFPIAHF